MPNIVSAEKRLRQSIKRNLANRKIKSTLNTLRKRVLKFASLNEKENACEAFKKYSSAIDKAARKSIIHANKAANKKSSLMLVISKIS